MYMSALRSCSMGRRKHQKNQEKSKYFNMLYAWDDYVTEAQRTTSPTKLLVNNTNPRGPHFRGRYTHIIHYWLSYQWVATLIVK